MKELYCEKTYRNGKLRSVCYYKDETKQKLHREDGPAITQYYENGNKKYDKYFIEGKLHREDGPAITQYYENGNKKYDKYFIEGKLHREDGPAIICYRENGSKEYEEYYKTGERHRIDGPSREYFYENGNKICEVYYMNGKRHRENGPAHVQYYENGNKECEVYFKCGLCHREDGPAGIWYDEDGVERSTEYYINGKKQYTEYINNNIEINKQNIIWDKSYDRNINDFIGRTVRHFKGNEYLVLCTALNTESDEIMVIYKSLYGENITYARPLKMFMEEVPANKENPTGQKYRFQLAYL